MRGFCRSVFLAQCLLAAGSILSPASAEPSTFLDDFQQLSGLLQAGETAEGLNLARDLEQAYAGIPEFDYLYGLAAIAERDYNTASFAFERILILQPDHHRARLEYARSQFHLGHTAEARQQFRTVLEANPPEQVKQRVEEFLEAIDRKETESNHQLVLNLNYGLGYDSNVNTATDLPTLDLFGLRFLIPDTSREAEDSFMRWGGDGEYQFRISQTQAVSAGLSYERKDNVNEDPYDISDAGFYTGYSQQLGDHRLAGKLKFSQYWLDEQPLVRLAGLDGQWQYTAGKSRPYAFLSASVIRYPDNDFQDRDQYLAGFGFQQLWRSAYIDVSAYGAHEPARQAEAKALGRDHVGVNAKLAWQYAPSQTIGLEAGYLHSRYHERNFLFGETRQDEKLNAELFWLMQTSPRMQLTLKAAYRNNHSSLSLYSYDQVIAEAGLVYRIF